MAGMETPSLPRDVKVKLAELELELSEGDITQKGYEKKKAKLLAPYIPQTVGIDPFQLESRLPGPLQSSPFSSSVPYVAASRQPKSRASNSRDERYRSDIKQISSTP